MTFSLNHLMLKLFITNDSMKTAKSPVIGTFHKVEMQAAEIEPNIFCSNQP